jgi:hypothetical protein
VEEASKKTLEKRLKESLEEAVLAQEASQAAQVASQVASQAAAQAATQAAAQAAQAANHDDTVNALQQAHKDELNSSVSAHTEAMEAGVEAAVEASREALRNEHAEEVEALKQEHASHMKRAEAAVRSRGLEMDLCTGDWTLERLDSGKDLNSRTPDKGLMRHMSHKSIAHGFDDSEDDSAGDLFSNEDEPTTGDTEEEVHTLTSADTDITNTRVMVDGGRAVSAEARAAAADRQIIALREQLAEAQLSQQSAERQLAIQARQGGDGGGDGGDGGDPLAEPGRQRIFSFDTDDAASMRSLTPKKTLRSASIRSSMTGTFSDDDDDDTDTDVDGDAADGDDGDEGAARVPLGRTRRYTSENEQLRERAQHARAVAEAAKARELRVHDDRAKRVSALEAENEQLKVDLKKLQDMLALGALRRKQRASRQRSVNKDDETLRLSEEDDDSKAVGQGQLRKGSHRRHSSPTSDALSDMTVLTDNGNLHSSRSELRKVGSSRHKSIGGGGGGGGMTMSQERTQGGAPLGNVVRGSVDGDYALSMEDYGHQEDDTKHDANDDGNDGVALEDDTLAQMKVEGTTGDGMGDSMGGVAGDATGVAGDADSLGRTPEKGLMRKMSHKSLTHGFDDSDDDDDEPSTGGTEDNDGLVSGMGGGFADAAGERVKMRDGRGMSEATAALVAAADSEIGASRLFRASEMGATEEEETPITATATTATIAMAPDMTLLSSSSSPASSHAVGQQQMMAVPSMDAEQSAPPSTAVTAVTAVTAITAVTAVTPVVRESESRHEVKGGAGEEEETGGVQQRSGYTGYEEGDEDEEVMVALSPVNSPPVNLEQLAGSGRLSGGIPGTETGDRGGGDKGDGGGGRDGEFKTGTLSHAMAMEEKATPAQQSALGTDDDDNDDDEEACLARVQAILSRLSNGGEGGEGRHEGTGKGKGGDYHGSYLRGDGGGGDDSTGDIGRDLWKEIRSLVRKAKAKNINNAGDTTSDGEARRLLKIQRRNQEKIGEVEAAVDQWAQQLRSVAETVNSPSGASTSEALAETTRYE